MGESTRSEMSNARSATVKSAARVLEIFEYFDETRRPVTIHEAAEALGYPHSSSAALLKSLVALGYLDHDERAKTFFPSIRISLLGNWIEAETLPVRHIHRLMQHLSDETGCTVILAMRSGAYVQYIKVLQGTTPIRFHVKPGTRRLLPFSTIGRVLLAALSTAKGSQLIKETLSRNPEAAAQSQAQIEDELTGIRRRGYAFYTGLVTPNATMLAMPVAKTRAGEPVAIGIAAPKDHFKDRKQAYIDLMKEAIKANITEAAGNPVSPEIKTTKKS